MIEPRYANKSDLDQLIEFDEILDIDEDRLRALNTGIVYRSCWVAGRQHGVLEAYIVLEPKCFFYRDFVSLLFVKPDARRAGLATSLFDVAERRSTTSKIFTSTNSSNKPMRRFLQRRGYDQVGEIRGLDPGDPELLFAKMNTEIDES